MSNKLLGIVLIAVALIVVFDTAYDMYRLGVNWPRGLLLLVAIVIGLRGVWRVFSRPSK